MKHLIRLAVIEVVFIVLGILSGSLRTFLGDTSLIWRSLGAPPGKAIRVVDGDFQAVRVQTIEGKIYFCRLHSRKECWIDNHQSTYSPYLTGDSSWMFRSYREPPLPPGVVYTGKFYNSFSE